MREVIVDASVIAKFFLEEEDSELARSSESHFEFSAPDLLAAELCNLFWKRVRRADLTPKDAPKPRLELLPSVVELCPVKQIAADAMTLSVLLDRPAYDCFYVALACSESSHCSQQTTD